MRIAGVLAAMILLAVPRLALACGGGGSGYGGGGGGGGPDPFSECIRWQPEDAGDSGTPTDGGSDAGLLCIEPATYSMSFGCSSVQGALAPLVVLFALLAFRPRRRAAIEATR